MCVITDCHMAFPAASNQVHLHIDTGVIMAVISMVYVLIVKQLFLVTELENCLVRID
jgi:hypothetical protein